MAMRDIPLLLGKCVVLGPFDEVVFVLPDRSAHEPVLERARTAILSISMQVDQRLSISIMPPHMITKVTQISLLCFFPVLPSGQAAGPDISECRRRQRV
jgi:hypothetical protein